jgi:NAD(P)H-hydrate repair Nnr-like enzyme with NAD(P)H-hydrate dehydratase domain
MPLISKKTEEDIQQIAAFGGTGDVITGLN